MQDALTSTLPDSDDDHVAKLPPIGTEIAALTFDDGEFIGSGTFVGMVPIEEAIRTPLPKYLPQPKVMPSAEEIKRRERIIADMIRRGEHVAKLVMYDYGILFGCYCQWHVTAEDSSYSKTLQ